MANRAQALGRVLVPLALLAACRSEPPEVQPTGAIHTSRLEPLSIVPATSSSPLRWPQFLLTEGGDRFLWGERGMFRIEPSASGPVLTDLEGSHLTRGFDRLVAASRSPEGALAILDTSGRVAVHDPVSGKASRFETALQNRPGDLAVTKDRVYLLLRGEVEVGNAVAAYDFSGAEVGRWGEMPISGIIQANLGGGGIAACPDGSIFYSYINSPLIFRLEEGSRESVRTIGEQSGPFEVLSEGDIRDAMEEGKRSRSVAPLVKLGFGGSRVMSLMCSQDGLLFRQVARPSKQGAYIEVWDPASETLIDTILGTDGALLDVRDQILYLGAMAEDEAFELERIQYRAGPSRREEAAD